MFVKTSKTIETRHIITVVLAPLNSRIIDIRSIYISISNAKDIRLSFDTNVSIQLENVLSRFVLVLRKSLYLKHLRNIMFSIKIVLLSTQFSVLNIVYNFRCPFRRRSQDFTSKSCSRPTI